MVSKHPQSLTLQSAFQNFWWSISSTIWLDYFYRYHFWETSIAAGAAPFVPVRPSDIRAPPHLLELALPMEGDHLIRIMSPHLRSTGVSERIPVRSKHHVYMQQSPAVYESPTATRTILRIYHRSIAGIALPGTGKTLPDRRTNSGSVQVLTLQWTMVCSIHIMLITTIHSTGILVTSILHLPWTRFLSSFHCFCPVSPGAMESPKYQLHGTAIIYPGLERMLLQRFSSRVMCTKKSDN
jgi:hypothetical protein